MAKRTKKVGVTGKWGTRYGGAIRKILRKFELQQRAKYICPVCGKVTTLLFSLMSEESLLAFGDAEPANQCSPEELTSSPPALPLLLKSR